MLRDRALKWLQHLLFMRQNSDYPNYTYDCNGEISQGDITIHCFNGNAHGSEDLRSSFANSCNSSFANIGLGLGSDAIPSDGRKEFIVQQIASGYT